MIKNFLSGCRLRISDTDRDREKKSIDKRARLDSDLGRVIFSPCCRRLHDKTQVFPLTTDDNIHSRLTHSLEVMSVGRTFAANLMPDDKFISLFLPKGKSKDSIDDMINFYRDIEALLSIICLAHDIGNPPFGHFGETILQNYFKSLFHDLREDLKHHKCDEDYTHQIITGSFAIIDSEEKIENRSQEKEKFIQSLEKFLDDKDLMLDYTQFDGNAQGFRIMTKLQFLNDLYGLNLTSATLASFLKYPNCGEKNKEKIFLHKHGVFTTEEQQLKIVMEKCGIESDIEAHSIAFHRHPFSYLMEASDTICYLTMDFEDAINKHWLSYETLKKILKKNKYGSVVVDDALSHCKKKDPDKKKVVQLRTSLMNYYVKFATERFKNNIDAIVDGTFNYELLDDGDKDNLAKLIGNECRKLIFAHKEIESLELTANAILTGIMNYYVEYLFHPDKGFRMRAKRMLSKAIFYTTMQEHFDILKSTGSSKINVWKMFPEFDPCKLTVEERLRIIRDFVSGMTDKFALSHYRRLTGQQI